MPRFVLSSHGVVFHFDSWSSIKHAEIFMRVHYFIKVQDTNAPKPYTNWMSDIDRPHLAFWPPETHRVGGNRKRYKQSRNADQNAIETVFSIAFCRQWGVKWQSKTLFLLILINVPR